MKHLIFGLAAVLPFFGLASCTTTNKAIQNDTAPAAGTANTTETVTLINDWFHKDPLSSPYYGISTKQAYNNFLADKQPKKSVIVAIIDSGTDIEHEDLAANIWVNEDEIPDNGKDDDDNGYIDDLHGWNFIGGPNGQHVEKDTYVLTRMYSSLSRKYGSKGPSDIAPEYKKEYEKYLEIKSRFERRVKRNKEQIRELSDIVKAIDVSKQILGISCIDSASTEELKVDPNDQMIIKQAKQIFQLLKQDGVTETTVSDTQKYLEHLIRKRDYGLNPNFNPRKTIGDNYEDFNDRFYGNNDVKGPASEHGTHVAGIIGAVRNNGLGMDGISAHAKLMIIRTVPDGDERDKDVANAIRYAVENGADIINMSFGKEYSPHKVYVDEAIRLADRSGVLMVSGAGNNGESIEDKNNYPSRYYADGNKANNYLMVGASSWKPDSALAASFSNYGQTKVDLFAPGVDIYSTYPNHTYKMENGTSMAAPVVAGVAALIMTYYPELQTSEVKQILLDSSIKVDQEVNKPGSTQSLSFERLSASGGIVNALQALKLAESTINNGVN
ncbi:MAG: peptidase S8 [Balneolaceae bacterium]|nr:peptidase S8 [Balneolaceae bacterium]